VGLGSQTRLRTITPQKLNGQRLLRLRGRSLSTFGLRQAYIHLLASVTQIIAVLLVALSTAGISDVFIEGRRQAGASLLAQFLSGQAALFQLILGSVALASGITLARLTRRIDLADRAPQWAAMRAMGWTSTQLQTVQRAETMTIAIPATLIAAAVSYIGALLLGSPAILPLVAVSVGAAIVASVTLLLVQRKAATR
jgi:hypothetical protein